MYTKEEIWASFTNEIRIIKHLGEKISPDGLDHKPTEKQRTTLELMQYIARMGKGVFRAVLEERTEGFTGYITESEGVTLENFAEMMDKQEIEMKELYEKFNDAELAKVLSLWGRTAEKRFFILDALKMITAYKMQLFLYIKASSDASIGTINLWAGMDAPAPQITA